MPGQSSRDETRRGDEPATAVTAGPRPTSRRFLDLQPYANQKLKDRFAGIEGNDLSGLPAGEQTLAGVPFLIGEGLIQLAGRGTPRPSNVEGIPVGTTFSELHILHATQWQPDANPDAVVGYYRVNYEDNRQETIAIVYDKDVSNWWYRDDKGCGRAEAAWKGTNAAARQDPGITLRLYVTRWKNSAPDRKVVSIDFASTNSPAAPFCVAMTAEE
jgi:hypothetical protein